MIESSLLCPKKNREGSEKNIQLEIGETILIDETQIKFQTGKLVAPNGIAKAEIVFEIDGVPKTIEEGGKIKIGRRSFILKCAFFEKGNVGKINLTENRARLFIQRLFY